MIREEPRRYVSGRVIQNSIGAIILVAALVVAFAFPASLYPLFISIYLSADTASDWSVLSQEFEEGRRTLELTMDGRFSSSAVEFQEAILTPGPHELSFQYKKEDLLLDQASFPLQAEQTEGKYLKVQLDRLKILGIQLEEQ